MLQPRAVVGSILLLVFMLACERRPGELHREVASMPEVPISTLPGVLVSASWLLHHQDEPDLLIIDVRLEEQYKAGHIPGAVPVPVASLNGHGDNGERDLASVPALEKALREAGVTMSQRVVVYDGAVDYRPASRVFWALEVHGLPSVAVLNGGLPAWQSLENSSLSTTTPTVTPSRFVAELKPDRIATKLHVLQVSSTGEASLVDSRSAAEYRGDETKGARAGHIRGAKNYDFNNNLDTTSVGGQCSLEDLDTLAETYADLPKDEKVITYCNSGNRASVTYLSLRALGYDVAVYDGGWIEWSEYPQLPIETGQP